MKKNLFSAFKQGLKKTRSNFASGIANIFLGKKIVDVNLLDEIETRLLLADLGVATTEEVIQNLTAAISRKELDDADALHEALKKELENILEACDTPLLIPSTIKPYVILMVGVNGSGKTTTIGKLASILHEEGKTVMLAAGDTYRAAAIEQLKVWGERNHVPVVAQQSGADSASVIYDAFQSAKANNIDVLIADTAGRLHTQKNLMEELKKIKRVISKLDAAAPHEVMLVLDAGIGQNALQQAKEFNDAIGVTGITLTKLDGTAKGGIIFAIAKTLGLPIRFVGIGEGLNDLKIFKAEEFTEALFEE